MARRRFVSEQALIRTANRIRRKLRLVTMDELVLESGFCKASIYEFFNRHKELRDMLGVMNSWEAHRIYKLRRAHSKPAPMPKPVPRYGVWRSDTSAAGAANA